MKERLTELEKSIDNMLNAIQQGIIFDSTKRRLSDLEEKKKALELELIQEQIKSPILTKEQILFGITKFRTLDLSTRQGRQTLIDSFVNAIYLYDDYALITCNYKDGSIRISFEEIESSDLLSNGVPVLPRIGGGVCFVPTLVVPDADAICARRGIAIPSRGTRSLRLLSGVPRISF